MKSTAESSLSAEQMNTINMAKRSHAIIDDVSSIHFNELHKLQEFERLTIENYNNWMPFEDAPIGSTHYKGRTAVFWSKSRGIEAGYRTSQCEIQTDKRGSMRPTHFKWIEPPITA